MNDMQLSAYAEGYKWIKVKQHKFDSAKSWEDNYRDLEQHHIAEAKYLVDEVRKLADILITKSRPKPRPGYPSDDDMALQQVAISPIGLWRSAQLQKPPNAGESKHQ